MSPTPDKTPRRYQRKRSVSTDIPLDAIYVGRPTRWGNPYKIGEPFPDGSGKITRELAVVLYQMELKEALGYDSGTIDIDVVAAVAELRGKDLVCWCPLDRPCHADVLLELANL